MLLVYNMLENVSGVKLQDADVDAAGHENHYIR